MITTEMVLAAAQAIYESTHIAKNVQWDLLPNSAQFEMQELALAALNAAEPLRPKDS